MSEQEQKQEEPKSAAASTLRSAMDLLREDARKKGKEDADKPLKGVVFRIVPSS